MAPPPWRLRAVEGLADSLPSPAGLLLGAVDDSARAITLLGAVPAPAAGSAKEVAAAAAQVLALLPHGVHVTGCYGCATPPPLSAPGAPPVGHTAAGGFTLGGEPAAAEPVAAPPTTTLAPPGFAAVRCRCDALLRVAAPAGGGGGGGGSSAAALARAFGELQQQLAGPGLAFISEQQGGGSGSDTTTSPRALLTASSAGALQAALPAPPAGDPCVTVSPLSGGGSSAAAGGGSRPAAPVLSFEPAAEGTVITEVVLGLDVLALLPSASDARAAPAALAAALGRQLEAIESDLAARLAAAGGQPAAVVPVRAHHFRPPGWAVPLTVCYPRAAGADEAAAEAELLPARRALHALLGLPDSVPMLRFANALAWGAGGGGGGGDGGGGSKVARLRDVHIGVAPPPIAGSPALIRGSYEYYHYMQDRFNDSGWGCAYRSLQTIISWFRQQRYTSKPVPSHREIQSMLVKLGDKEPSFIGSSQWIGAIELGYILEEYLGVTSKIMTVSRGADIPSHARELAAHFEAQGTPVMIGGGVLAYTLLGVQFDELTGRAAFLILDPHYTGGEDLKKVQQGTWVAWKMPGDSAAAGGPLYVDDTFYNFLLPQRPATV